MDYWLWFNLQKCDKSYKAESQAQINITLDKSLYIFNERSPRPVPFGTSFKKQKKVSGILKGSSVCSSGRTLKALTEDTVSSGCKELFFFSSHAISGRSSSPPWPRACSLEI